MADKVIKKIILVLFIFLNVNLYSNFRRDINTGNKFFEQKKYDEALEKYNSAELKKPNSPVIYYNRANTFYKQQLYNEAIQEYQKSLGLTKDKNLKSKIFYNLGNTFLKLGDTKKAKESYIQGLLLNPKDEEIKYNLQYALMNIHQPQQEKSKKDDSKEDKQENQQNKQNQQKYMSQQDVQRLIETVTQQQKDKLKETLKPQKPQLPEVDKDW
ncbi:MAG: tetratricopeptide repeat protein [Endomicrobiia bacterium]